MGENTLAIATMILGETSLENAGFPVIDVTSSEYDNVRKRVEPQLEIILSNFNEAIYTDMEDFTDRGAGNLSSFIRARLKQSPENYFTYLAEEQDTSGVDALLFITDEKERGKVFNKWLGEEGGIAKPSDHKDDLDSFEVNAYGIINRELLGTDTTSGMVGEITDQYIREGKVLDWVPGAAADLGLSPEDFVLQSVKANFKNIFIKDEEGIQSWYDKRVEDKARSLRQKAYEDDPSGAATALKSRLFTDRNYWVDDLPVDPKRVSPEVWADWTHVVTEFGLSAALTYIVPQLQSAVGSFKMSDFDRNKAEAQAKDFFERKSIKWADIPMEQQQAIISQIEARGGMDVERAVRLPDTGPIGIDPNEQIDAGITADPEALFGERLKEFATIRVSMRYGRKLKAR